MRVIHAIGSYLPETVGGTEIYLKGLSSELNGLGVDSRILAGSTGPGPVTVNTDAGVDRYPVAPASTRAQIRGRRPHTGFARFEGLLSASGADLYHQHGWSYGCGLHHLKCARGLGLPTVLTIHLPGNLCLRGTMMRGGKTVCDGRIDEQRCGACWLQSKGMPGFAAQVFSRLPTAISRRFASHSTSRYGTVAATRALVGEHRSLFRETVATTDRLVSVCNWLDRAIRRNAVDEDKLQVCRHGVDRSFADAQRGERPAAGGSLDIGFVGRADPVKGLETLIAAMLAAPEARARLFVHASCNSAQELDHLNALQRMAGGDPRIEFRGAVEHHDLKRLLRGFDMLAVPSVWLETGPLVVLEARACGLPILGSDLGGIAELVEDGIDGLLLPAGRVSAWRDAIRRLAVDSALLTRLTDGIGEVRSMGDVAREMLAMYSGMIDARQGRAQAG